MLPLRHVQLWRVLSATLLLCVLLAALAPTWWFDSRAQALLWLENADKWLHAVTFLGLSLWFAGLFARSAWWRVAAGLMLFGFVIEGCQLMVGYRMADWIDIGANTLGILLGLALAGAGLGGWGLRFEDWYSRTRKL